MKKGPQWALCWQPGRFTSRLDWLGFALAHQHQVRRWTQVLGHQGIVVLPVGEVAQPTDGAQRDGDREDQGDDAQDRMGVRITLLESGPHDELLRTLGTAVCGVDRGDCRPMETTLPAPLFALAQLAALHEKDQVLSRDITSVDLRLPDKAVFQPTTRANTLIERPDFSDTPDSAKKSI